jgi:PXPV repeat (3 copies)
MSKTTHFIAAGALALVGVLASGLAQARDNVHWSIGIHLPLDPYGATIGTTIGNSRPVIVQPAPVYYAPPPVYYAPPPVYYAPAPVIYRPAPVYYRHYRHYRPDARGAYRPAPVHGHRHDGWRRHGGRHDR